MTTYVDQSVIAGLGNPLPTSMVNNFINNDKYFRTPPQYSYVRSLVAANYTISSTTIADIDGTNLIATIVTTGNPILMVLFAGKLGNGAAGTVTFDAVVDGVSQTSGNGFPFVLAAAENKPVNLTVPILNLAAGSHTFKWQWKNSTNTATLFSANLITTLIREM